MKRLSMLSFDDVRKLNNFYSCNGIPRIPDGYEFDGFLSDVDSGVLVLTAGGYPSNTAHIFRDTVVIGLKKKKKYRFVCDNPDRVPVKEGDYVFISDEFVKIDSVWDVSGLNRVVFRLEELE